MNRKHIEALGIFLMLISLGMAILSSEIDVDFAEKHIIKGEVREQSKIGVDIFRSQLFFLGLVIGVFGFSLFVFSEVVIELLTKRKSFFQNLALLVITVLLMLLIGEILLRVFFAEQIYSEYGLGPGYKELAGSVSLNSFEYRDVEHSIAKGDSRRILIIGDSMTYGAGISDFDDTYGRILQKKLDEYYGEGAYEVIILSKPGYSTIDELRVLRDLGVKFSPDILIIGYHLNDAEGPTSRIGFEKLYFQHYFYPYAVGGWLYKNSFVFYLLESRLKNLFRAYGLEDVTYVDYIGHLYDWSTDFQDIHKKTFTALIQVAKSEGIETVVLDIPALIKDEEYPFFSAIDYVQNAALSNGAAYFNLLPVLSQHDPEELRVSFLDGHLNEKAHAVAGESLFGYLLENKLIGQNLPENQAQDATNLKQGVNEG